MSDLPDPDGIYEAVQGFVGQVPDVGEVIVRDGTRYSGRDPVVAHYVRLYGNRFFRLAPDDVIRRQQAKILEALRSHADAEDAHAAVPDTPLQVGRPGTPHAGPDLIATRAEVEAVRDQLARDKLPYGYKSVAKKGGWSVSTVRRRLNGN